MIEQPAFSAKIFDQMRAMGSDQDLAVRRMEFMAKLLDSAFVLPGSNKRVGIDAIIGLVPGIGDIVTTALSSYIIWEARNLGVSRFALSRMLANLAIHATIGWVPLLGDIFDAFFRVNQRNMRIVREQLASGRSRRPAAQRTITVPMTD